MAYSREQQSPNPNSTECQTIHHVNSLVLFHHCEYSFYGLSFRLQVLHRQEDTKSQFLQNLNCDSEREYTKIEAYKDYMKYYDDSKEDP